MSINRVIIEGYLTRDVEMRALCGEYRKSIGGARHE